jgi:hypothetical protein
MYTPYPTSGPAQEPEQIQPPRSVLNAVKLMYAGAALEVLAVIIAVVTIGTLKSAILAKHPAYTAESLHTAEVARTVLLVSGGLIAIGLLRLDGQVNIAAANRRHARGPQRTLKLLQTA